MNDQLSRITRLHPLEELDDAHLARLWADVEHKIAASAPVPRIVIAPRRRRGLALGGGVALAGGLAVALFATLALVPQGGDPTSGGPAGGLARLTPAPASAAEVVRRVRHALASDPAAVVYSIERSPIVGQPGTVSVWERWQDADDPEVELDRSTENGELTFVSFRRHLDENRIVEYQYLPQQGIYTRHVTDADQLPPAVKWVPSNRSSVVKKAKSTQEPSGVLEVLRSQLRERGARLAGHATIRDHDALVIADAEPRMHRLTYVDPDTYLPIRMVERPDGIGKITIDYRYLDADNRNVLNWAPPASAQEVDVLPGG